MLLYDPIAEKSNHDGLLCESVARKRRRSAEANDKDAKHGQCAETDEEFAKLSEAKRDTPTEEERYHAAPSNTRIVW